MFSTHQYKIIAALVLSGFLVACDQKKPNGNNTVTVNPPIKANQNDAPLPAGMDKSPMDMVYYPVEYPKMKMSNSDIEAPIARVIYSRPQKSGRIIFGDVVKYGSIWRLGANEATEIEFFRNVTIQNKSVPKGRYILYGIPFENKWTLILNNDLFTWGLKIDSTKDAYKFSIPIAKTNFPFDVFTIEFEKADKGMHLIMEWDSVRAILPIRY